MRRTRLPLLAGILLLCVLAYDSTATRPVPKAPPQPLLLPTPSALVVPPGEALALLVVPEQGANAEPTVDDIRALIAALGTPRCGGQLLIDEKTGLPLPGQESREEKELRALGLQVLPACELILLDPGCTAEEMLGTVVVLNDLLYEFPAERERFVPLLVRRVARDNGFAPPLPDTVRGEIVRLLGEFGDESSAAALVPLLQEPNPGLWVPTAEALARTGGPNEFQALNAWVVGHNPHDPYAVKVRGVRDRFEARLRTLPPN